MPGMNPVWPSYHASNAAIQAKSESSGMMGKDAFLRILVEQLKNQDPLQPLQDREFIAQMAQFSSLEQLMNLSQKMDRIAQAMAASPQLIGKNIAWLGLSETGLTQYEGKVTAIGFHEGRQYALVDDVAVDLNDIIMIWEDGE